MKCRDFSLFFKNHSFVCKRHSLILCIKLITINWLKCRTPKQAHHLEYWENPQWAIGWCAGGTLPIQMEQLTDLSSAAHYWKQEIALKALRWLLDHLPLVLLHGKLPLHKWNVFKLDQVKRKKRDRNLCVVGTFSLFCKCNGFCRALHRSELIILSLSWHMLHALLHVQRFCFLFLFFGWRGSS